MSRWTSNSMLMIAMLAILLAGPSAQAADVKILKAAVGNSFGPGGEPQLDLNLLVGTSSPDPGSLIAYFSDGETGEPLSAPKGSPYSTPNGQVAAKSGLISGTSKSVVVEQQISIPHFALSVERYKRHKIRVSFYLDAGDYSDEFEYIDDIGFEFITDNPFKHGKHRKRRGRRQDVVNVRLRDRLPDRPILKRDGLGLWTAYTTAGGIPLPRLDRRSVVTVFQERGRSVILGGTLQWRNEGSSDNLAQLIKQLDTENGIVLPRTPTIINGEERSRIVVESRLVEVNRDMFLVDYNLRQIDAIDGNGRLPILGDIPTIGRLFRNADSMDTKRNLQILITPRILELAD